MPPFCPQCGEKLAYEDAKFCPECGYSLMPKETAQSETPQISKVPTVEEAPRKSEFNIYEIGVKLEQNIELLYQAKGYQTERRQRLQGDKAVNEIDVVAKKENELVAIECKNYNHPVGIEKIREFDWKLKDLGTNWHGVFIAWNDFTEDAEDLAESTRIEIWGHDEITEKIAAFYVGRYGVKGEKIELDPALALNYDYENVTSIALKNKEKVSVRSASLYYHPYYKIEYHLRDEVQDPSKKIHHIDDKGVVIIDALGSRVLNSGVAQDNVIQGAVQSLMKIASQKEKAISQRREKLKKEIREHTGQKYTIDIVDDFVVNKLRAEMTLKEAEVKAIDFVIDRNTTNFTYVKTKKGYDNVLQMRYIPKKKAIMTIRKDIVLVPRWEVTFGSLGKVYSREVLGCSGTVLEDAMMYCPNHLKIGALSRKKNTIAVCEFCGGTFCEEHIRQCQTCQKWICEDDAIE